MTTRLNDVSAEVSTPPAARLLEWTDRLFPLVWLAFYLLLPVSGEAAAALTSAFDQTRDLDALRSVLDEGRADAIDRNLIGPAYIAVAALVHHVSGLTPEDSLIALTRISYALSIAGGMVLVRLLVRRLAPAPPAASLGAQIGFLGLAFAAWTWSWSDFPWSHFFAAFVCVALYVARLAPPRASLAGAAAVGGLLALLALARSFEFLAVVAAWGLGLAVLALLRLGGGYRPRAAGLALGAGAFVATAAAAHLATGKHEPFLLYQSERVGYGDLLPQETDFDAATFSFDLVPAKVVQIAFDPCFYSLCALNDYADGSSPWRLPLALQLPSLVVLPLVVLAVAALLGWFVRHRDVAAPRARELRILVEMTIAAVILAAGYTSSTWASSSALKHGFARDYFLPATLTGVVALSLAFTGLWLALSRDGRRLRWSPGFATVALGLLGAAALVAVVVGARFYGLPRFESRHLESVRYTADCRGRRCDVEIDATTTSGKSISIPEQSFLTFGCGDAKPRFTTFAREPADGVRVADDCVEPRLVAAWPAVMGVPPNRQELYVVKVANRTAAA